MAYTDTRHTHKKLAGATGVALVHIALAFGLAAGLTIKYTAPEPPKRIQGTNVEIELPPPPPPEERTVEPAETTSATKPDYVPPVAPPSDFDLTRSNRVAIADIPPIRPFDGLIPDSIGGAVALPPVPPAYTPKAAVPANGPVGWLTTNDYPTRALMRGWEGDMSYALDIDASGRVTECRVLASTGHSILDREACKVIERRARFEPATDATGSAVAGRYTGRVTWMIPED